MAAYPAALRPTGGKGAGKDRLRHVRSAWDVAGAAPSLPHTAVPSPDPPGASQHRR
jgi:hypothetical protein